MTFRDKLKTLERIHQLIRRKGTGSPKDLADRLQLSERCVYNLIDILRDLHGPIKYCRNRCSYHYENTENIPRTIIGSNDSDMLKGGKISSKYEIFNVTAWKVQCKYLYLA